MTYNAVHRQGGNQYVLSSLFETVYLSYQSIVDPVKGTDVDCSDCQLSSSCTQLKSYFIYYFDCQTLKEETFGLYCISAQPDSQLSQVCCLTLTTCLCFLDLIMLLQKLVQNVTESLFFQTLLKYL